MNDLVVQQGPINVCTQTVNKMNLCLSPQIIPLENHPLSNPQTLPKFVLGLSPKVDLVRLWLTPSSGKSTLFAWGFSHHETTHMRRGFMPGLWGELPLPFHRMSFLHHFFVYHCVLMSPQFVLKWIESPKLFLFFCYCFAYHSFIVEKSGFLLLTTIHNTNPKFPESLLKYIYFLLAIQ